jgi:DNA-binding response OmpR family regulator
MKAAHPYRVLVVDDNRDAADSMAMMLEACGHQACPIYDGRQALKVFQEFKPDAAVLDIGLPHISGYELAAQFRQQSDCVLIAVSGWGTERDKEQARNWGFHQHLTKPADPHEVITLIDELCAAQAA